MYRGQTTDGTNFRADINDNGRTESSDVGLVKENKARSKRHLVILVGDSVQTGFPELRGRKKTQLASRSCPPPLLQCLNQLGSHDPLVVLILGT